MTALFTTYLKLNSNEILNFGEPFLSVSEFFARTVVFGVCFPQSKNFLKILFLSKCLEFKALETLEI
jgi:hypothetical protein